MKKILRIVSRWPVCISAVIVTLMAGAHGVLGEALFSFLEHYNSLLFASGAALLLGVIAWLSWNHKSLFDRIFRRHEQPKSSEFDMGLSLFAILLFVMMMAAQGVVALSAGHFVAKLSHENFGLMMAIGAASFAMLTLALWSLKDRLFSLDTKVTLLDEGQHPLQAVVVVLSPSGDGDSEQFKAAKIMFDTHLQKAGWAAALGELTKRHPKGDLLERWNFQQPLRMLKAMTRTVARPGKRRVMIFLTTKESNARYGMAKELLTHIVSHMPAERGPKPDICQAGRLGKWLAHCPEIGTKPDICHPHVNIVWSDNESDYWVENNHFEKSFEIIRRVLKALKTEFEPEEIAFDTTGGTAEHTVLCAIATIDSQVSFTYVNTNDGEVRRFNVCAKGIGVSE